MNKTIQWMGVEDFFEIGGRLACDDLVDTSDDSPFLNELWSNIEKFNRYLLDNTGWPGYGGEGPVFLSDNLRGSKCLFCEVDLKCLQSIRELQFDKFLENSCPDYLIMLTVFDDVSKVGNILITSERVIATESLRKFSDKI
jgi:hypothetical protein